MAKVKFKTQKNEFVATDTKDLSQQLQKNYRNTRTDLDVLLDYVDTQISNMIKISKKNGFTLSNNSGDANNDIDIASGSSPDSTRTVFMNGSAMTKRLDAAWAAGTNQGGLFSGSKANSTWYAVFAIYKDSDGSVDYGFDTSAIAANRPAGYTYYKLIGSIKTNSSGNIIAFFQIDNRFYLVTPIIDYDGTVGTASSTSITLSVPTGFDTIAMMNVGVYLSSAYGGVYLFNSKNADIAPVSTDTPLFTLRSTSGGAGAIAFAQAQVPTVSGAIKARASAASTTLRIATIGWIDQNI